MNLYVFGFALLFLSTTSAQPTLNRDELHALAKYRQQHRRTTDGRLCAAAFVQDREAFTGCTATKSPDGMSGREWCYVEAQVAMGSASPPWQYCASVADYDHARNVAANTFKQKASAARGLVAKLQKAQRAAELALDMYSKRCNAV